MRIALIVGILGSLISALLSAGCGARGTGMVTDANDGTTSTEAQAGMQTVGAPTGQARNTSRAPVTVLMDGGSSTVSAPFVAVVRDLETYTKFREVVGQLPAMNSDFFRSNTVVAAFLGMQRSAGYSVSFEYGEDDRLLVQSHSPAPGMMRAQVITAPLKIVSVQTASTNPLRLEVGAPWKSSMRTYHVTQGQFKLIGGSGKDADGSFKIEGDILVMRYGALATFEFDVVVPHQSATSSKDIVTGIVDPGGSIVLNGAYLPGPPNTSHQFLKLAGKFTGRFSANEDRLSLAFAAADTTALPGHETTGQIEAVATSPPPPKSTMRVID